MITVTEDNSHYCALNSVFAQNFSIGQLGEDDVFNALSTMGFDTIYWARKYTGVSYILKNNAKVIYPDFICNDIAIEVKSSTITSGTIYAKVYEKISVWNVYRLYSIKMNAKYPKKYFIILHGSKEYWTPHYDGYYQLVENLKMTDICFILHFDEITNILSLI